MKTQPAYYTTEDPTAAVMHTYGRYPVTFVRGAGARLWDSHGKEYIDLLAGVAVVASGHANEAVARAITAHAHTLVHVSNYFWNEPMLSLANKLRSLSPWPAKMFFCNSGAEAIECALKLARKWAGKNRPNIVAAVKGFHGRTYGALAATGSPSKWEGFAPLPGGFVHAEFNHLESFDRAINGSTAAVLVEVIQGEGGVIPGTREFLRGLRDLCTRRGVLLILDEIQCGIGRTGTWWGFEQYGIVPDVFTSAKGLANGLPIGVCISAPEIAEALTPGTHGSTFGGGPLVCAAALANLEYIESQNLLGNAQLQGAYLTQQMQSLPGVKLVRGVGLMLAAVLTKPKAKEVAARALQAGVIVNNVTDDALRLVPPLVVTKQDIDTAVLRLLPILREVL